MHVTGLEYAINHLSIKFKNRFTKISLIFCLNLIILDLQSIVDCHKIVTFLFGRAYRIRRQSFFIFTSFFSTLTYIIFYHLSHAGAVSFGGYSVKIGDLLDSDSQTQNG